MRLGEVDIRCISRETVFTSCKDRGNCKVFIVKRAIRLPNMNKFKNLNGCPYTFLIVYTTAKNFDLGYKTIFNHFDKYAPVSTRMIVF